MSTEPAVHAQKDFKGRNFSKVRRLLFSSRKRLWKRESNFSLKEKTFYKPRRGILQREVRREKDYKDSPRKSRGLEYFPFT